LRYICVSVRRCLILFIVLVYLFIYCVFILLFRSYA